MLIIDIRRLDKYKQYGVMPGSYKLTFFDKNGKYNTKEWLNKLNKVISNKDQEFIFVCAHANRTKTVGNFLSKKAGYKNVRELSSGIIDGWIKKGLKTSKGLIIVDKP